MVVPEIRKARAFDADLAPAPDRMRPTCRDWPGSGRRNCATCGRRALRSSPCPMPRHVRVRDLCRRRQLGRHALADAERAAQCKVTSLNATAIQARVRHGSTDDAASEGCRSWSPKIELARPAPRMTMSRGTACRSPRHPASTGAARVMAERSAHRRTTKTMSRDLAPRSPLPHSRTTVRVPGAVVSIQGGWFAVAARRALILNGVAVRWRERSRAA